MMKNLMKITGVLLVVLIAFSSFKYSDNRTEVIVWETKTIDLGELEKGDAVTKQFVFTNQHDETIKIVRTKASCGCTVTEHTTGEILSGEKGYVSAKYTAKQSGPFQKTIQVFTTAGEEAITLQIKGVVK
ncbi:DUF1573 domain-containing protein [Marivirga sp. S37H4]|uniref:DUF1573 domain-containing protein n=1 Tax=Marivirga aurantiaca TaxID=2802615 RepID=A0A934WZ23_9BACT|nr:DUF1573 domain-containing protein [Marivirga aurantiaca]MBK6265536.1 DUF1573 domain-containing protein [Marivirga aurantiaca]